MIGQRSRQRNGIPAFGLPFQHGVVEKLEVHGTVAPGFERVGEELAAALAEETHNEPGSQLAAYLGGRLVVDLTVGDDFPAEKLTGLYSVTKGAAHLVFALLVQDGLIDLDRRVAHYWPEFTGAGKEDLSVRGLLAHGAGLIGLDRPMTMAEIADDRRSRPAGGGRLDSGTV